MSKNAVFSAKAEEYLFCLSTAAENDPKYHGLKQQFIIIMGQILWAGGQGTAETHIWDLTQMAGAAMPFSPALSTWLSMRGLELPHRMAASGQSDFLSGGSTKSDVDAGRSLQGQAYS